MSRKKTMLDIAKHLGISRTTVSVCLTGDTAKYGIKQATVESVRSYADKIGFSPNLSARNLVMSGNAPKKIGLLMIRDSSEAKNFNALNLAIRLIEDANREYSFLSGPLSDINPLLSYHKSFDVKDVLIFGGLSEMMLRQEFYDDNGVAPLPLIRDMNLYILDFNFTNNTLPSQENNIYRFGIVREKLYNELFEMAVRKGFELLVCDGHCLSIEKFESFCLEKGLPFKKNQYFKITDRRKNPFEISVDFASQLLQLQHGESKVAVFTHDDKIAAGLIDHLLKNGVSIPNEMAIFGFDNLDLSPYLKIPLSSVELPLEKNVRTSLSKILGNETIEHAIISEPRIIYRESFI